MSSHVEARVRRRLDPVGTRKAILAAAVATFSERGYSGTAMGDVAEAAGVTKSLVQYHFETKEQLWQTALTASMQPFLEAVDNYLISERTHEDVVMLLHERFELFESRPECVRMLGWASLEPSPLPEAAVSRAPKVWGNIMAERPEADRRRMLVALAAIDGWMLMRRLYGGIMGQDLTQPDLGLGVLETIESALLGQGDNR